jgi:hypothetical protein
MRYAFKQKEQGNDTSMIEWVSHGPGALGRCDSIAAVDAAASWSGDPTFEPVSAESSEEEAAGCRSHQ